jgi:beta-phosphoglucomutase family hydrolase
MIKAVIFDLDGVIVDSFYQSYLVKNKIFKKYGFAITFNEFMEYKGGRAREMLMGALKAHGKKVDISHLLEENEKYLIKTFSKKAKPIPGSIELIKQLKKNWFKIAVASGSQRKKIEAVLSTLKIERFFDSVVSGEDVKKSKPDPQIFLLVSKRLGIKPENCLVIEDSQAGIDAARKAGMKSIGFVNKNFSYKLSGADLISDSIKKINIKMIRGL